MSDQGHHQENSNTITLRNFKRLQLLSLPRLKSICKGIMVCESLKDIVVDKCHTLRRLPLSLHMDNGQASAPPALQHIWGDNEWWESLDWADSYSKSILQPLYVRIPPSLSLSLSHGSAIAEGLGRGSWIVEWRIGEEITEFAIPLNKQLYTFSYVCVTSGATALVFSAFYTLVDIWNLKYLFLPLEWIGMNAMLVYVMATEGIFAAFINGWYYSEPHNTLVLVVGGGEGGVLREISRDNTKELIDICAIELAIGFEDPHVQLHIAHDFPVDLLFIIMAAVEVLRNVPEGKYDAIIIDSSDPIGSNLNLGDTGSIAEALAKSKQG
ncbi:hypothetical protein TEA_002321 [Camellia sinensis var. sinensis]|uniref:PABS domain-containing protein n=1 Tax=Camellia sinensis var. sinensis TaxID=542762 RepID=A0A4V3WLR5_CAMSN|nr:hypothetical protein TEA_002321 [Camellia sinensis var. sinensis]